MGNEIGNFAYPGFDYAAQQTKIERRKALLQAISQQGMEPLQTNRMSGGYAIPISPFEGLAKLAQTAAGVYGEKGLEKQQTDLATKAQGDYRTALAASLKNSDLSQGEIDSIAAAGSNPMAAQMMPFITSIAQQKRQMAMLPQLIAQLRGGVQAAPQGPQPGQGTVLAPGMSGAPQGGAAPVGGGGLPVGGDMALAGALLGNAGISKLGEMQHTDAGTRGGVQYDQSGKAFIVTNNGQVQYLQGITARDKNEMVDTGAGIQPTNPYTGAQGGPTIPKSFTPAQTVELPLKATDTALAAQKQGFETGLPMPKLPSLPGMMQPSPVAPQQLPQGARPIPPSGPITRGAPIGQPPVGTPLQPPSPGITPKAQAEMNANRAEAKPQATAAYGDAANNLDRLAKEVEGIMNDPALAKITGMVGKIPNAPGSAATNVAAKLEAVKSQVAFAVLQSMRNASKTGGALGSVSNFEEQMLQNNLAAITNTGQSHEAMKKNLQQIIDYATAAKGRMARAYQDTYGEAAPGSAPSAGPTEESVMQEYGKGGKSTKWLEDQLFQIYQKK